MRLSPRSSLAVLLAPLAACAAHAGSPDLAPPSLAVESPSRGTQSEGLTVEVTGTVVDDGVVRVSVNGVAASVGGDGRWSASVPVSPGVTILETIADDGTHQVRDARAVLAGALTPVTEPVAEALGARISPAAFTALGTALTAQLRAADVDTLAKAQNPIFDDGGCLGARVDIQRATVTDAAVGLTAAAAGLATDVTIDGLEVVLRVKYEVACLDDTTLIRIRASRVRVQGNLTIGVAEGKLTSALAQPQVTLAGFAIETGGLPGVIVDLLEGEIEDQVQGALLDLVRDEIPAMVQGVLADLGGSAQELDVLDRQVTLGLVPTAASLDASGLSLVLGASAVVAGGEGAVYAATPSPLAAAMGGDAGLSVALADDTLNQLLAGLWSTGALELTLPEEVGAALSLVVDPSIATVDLAPSLPPTARAEGEGLALTFGDLVLTTRDAAGDVVAELALSIETGLAVAAGADGALGLELGTPTVWAQVLSQRSATPIDGDAIAALVRDAWGLLGPALGDSLEGVTLPSVEGVALGAPSLVGRAGYLVVEATVP